MKLLHLTNIYRYCDYDFKVVDSYKGDNYLPDEIFLNPLKITYISEKFVHKYKDLPNGYKIKLIEIRLDSRGEYDFEKILVDRDLNEFILDVQEALYGFKTEIQLKDEQ